MSPLLERDRASGIENFTSTAEALALEEAVQGQEMPHTGPALRPG
jgi:hypothetical protein